MCATCGCGDVEHEHESAHQHGEHGAYVHEMGEHDHEHHGEHDHEHHGERGDDHGEHGHQHHGEHGHDHHGEHGHDHEHRRDHGHDHEPGEHDHDHEHGEHGHEHERPDARGRRIRLERDVLEKNDRAAERNRGFLAAREVLALNLVSAPGAGKTTLLERTVREAGLPICVIEGDQATSRDADRIRAAGARALQINTGTGCHLDAEMIERVLPELRPEPGTLLLIENVGNLVCPALFDLGERAKVLVASVTEGDDKPLKYPHMFRRASLVLLNKIDLLPHVAFEVGDFLAAAREVNPRTEVLSVSATTGDGLAGWYTWLRRLMPSAKGRLPGPGAGAAVEIAHS